MSDMDMEHPSGHGLSLSGASLAKLSMPRLAQVVPRPRLFALLDEARQRAAVWITAPGGAGKTTLAATYVSKRRLPYLWYQLDRDDADPATFFYYLGLAVRELQAAREVRLPLLTPEYMSDVAGFARRYFRKLFSILPQDAVLVLDNCQIVADENAFQEILRAAIGEIPDQSNVMVISRVDPPPLLARQRAIGSLAVVDWDELRLTLEETRAVAALRGKADKGLVRALHLRSEGWVAGLILLMEQMSLRPDVKQVFSAGSLQTVFDYFASEFFNALPETSRDFLIKTALFSHMTPDIAAAMSGNGQAAAILADLYRRHLFTDRRDLAVTSYQYHDLFREFLLNKGAEGYDAEGYGELMRQAARLLTAEERREEAIALYLRARDWEAATESILALAPQLLAQGRAQILGGWIQRMPAALVESAPWLVFWKGMSQQFINPFAARDMLEQAYAGFLAADDVVGRMLAASAVIDIVYVLRQSLLSAISWIDNLQGLLDAGPRFPSRTVEAKVLTSLISMLMFIRPQDPRLSRYGDRLVALIADTGIGANQRVWMAGQVVYYVSLIRGDMETANRILSQTWPLLEAPEITVVNNVFWRHMCVAPYFQTGREQEAREAIRPIMALIKDNNLPFMEVIACVFELLMHLRDSDTKGALPLLKRMERQSNPSLHPLDTAWLAFAKFMYAVVNGDGEAALDHGRSALEHHTRLGMQLVAMEISCIMAILHCEQGVFQEVEDDLAMPERHKFGASPYLHHQVLLVRAYAALLDGDRPACHAHLRRALWVAVRQPYFGNFFSWVPRHMLSRLCAEALQAGMEIDYVRQAVRRHQLLPEDATIDNWPWPVRVYGLGHFYVVKDGEPRLAETKAQRKPLRLLEVLIALGGGGIKVVNVSEILWPDADGDAAISAFTTTVSRLRKLIGRETVAIRRGRVSLDPRRCWADVAALEHQLDQAAAAGGDAATLRPIADRVAALYRGAFLADEEGDWPRALRERIRIKLCRFLNQCGGAAPGQPWSRHLVDRLITADPGLEEYCRTSL